MALPSTVGTAACVGKQALVHGVGAARHGDEPAAASHERVDALEPHVVRGKSVKDEARAIRQLVGDGRKLGEPLCPVRHVLLQHARLSLKEPQLG